MPSIKRPSGRGGPASAPSDSLHQRHRSHHHHNHSRSHTQLTPGDECEPEAGESILGVIWGLLVLGLSTLCIVGLLTLLIIMYLLIRPFSRPTYNRLAAQIGAASFLDAMALLMPNMTLYLTGDSDVPSPVGTSVLVCNHLMDGDWWAILMLGRCVGLRGSVKVFLRKEVLQESKASAEESGTGTLPNETVPTAVLPRSGSYGSSNQLIQPPGLAVSPPGVHSSGSAGGGIAGNGSPTRSAASPPIALIGRILHLLLEFPLLSSENNKNYIADRNELFTLLRSFAEGGAPVPVHLLLFPEGWSLQCANDRADRKSVMAKSVEFAKREGRPQLKHLLLPRTTGFNASLESLRESSPVVYDVTMAYRGYDGSVPMALDLSLLTLWRLIRGQIPSQVHFRIKRYSMEEVLQDATWLDKQWAEKDRALGHFSRHQSFPVDNRGFCRHRVFHTRMHGVESSVLGMARLGLLPFTIPFILLVSIPLFWTVLWIWLAFKAFQAVFPEWGRLMGEEHTTGIMPSGTGAPGAGPRQTPGSGENGGVDSVAGTPFFPATPFGSPSVTSWSYKEGDSPGRR